MIDTPVILGCRWVTQKEHDLVAGMEDILENLLPKKFFWLKNIQNHVNITKMKTMHDFMTAKSNKCSKP